MENKKKNEELQSRREFFKNAAKGALPILALTILGPGVLSSCSKDEPVKSSSGGSSDGCGKSCSGSCDGDCAGDCDDGCWTACISACVHYQR